jgi:hypothetical protein
MSYMGEKDNKNAREGDRYAVRTREWEGDRV